MHDSQRSGNLGTLPDIFHFHAHIYLFLLCSLPQNMSSFAIYVNALASSTRVWPLIMRNIMVRRIMVKPAGFGHVAVSCVKKNWSGSVLIGIYPFGIVALIIRSCTGSGLCKQNIRWQLIQTVCFYVGNIFKQSAFFCAGPLGADLRIFVGWYSYTPTTNNYKWPYIWMNCVLLLALRSWLATNRRWLNVDWNVMAYNYQYRNTNEKYMFPF